MDKRERITAALENYGLVPTGEEWATDDYGNPVVVMKGWRSIVEDEGRGLYDGDEGHLSAEVVGAAEYGNIRVSISFTPECQDPLSGPEVRPFEDVEIVD